MRKTTKKARTTPPGAGQPGICPRCGKDLTYPNPAGQPDGGTLTYYCKCKCGFKGQEVHNVEFSHFETA
jgi:hypothetical protein